MSFDFSSVLLKPVIQIVDFLAKNWDFSLVALKTNQVDFYLWWNKPQAHTERNLLTKIMYVTLVKGGGGKGWCV